MGLSPAHEDVEEGKRSARELAGVDFETGCFGHGQEILGGASVRFEEAFGTNPAESVGV